MTHYIATFHTHLAALKTHRNLTRQGVEARMSPVPRKISSSCGTCVQYHANEPMEDYMDEDVEAIYSMDHDQPSLWKEFN